MSLPSKSCNRKYSAINVERHNNVKNEQQSMRSDKLTSEVTSVTAAPGYSGHPPPLGGEGRGAARVSSTCKFNTQFDSIASNVTTYRYKISNLFRHRCNSANKLSGQLDQ